MQEEVLGPVERSVQDMHTQTSGIADGGVQIRGTRPVRGIGPGINAVLLDIGGIFDEDAITIIQGHPVQCRRSTRRPSIGSGRPSKGSGKPDGGGGHDIPTGWGSHGVTQRDCGGGCSHGGIVPEQQSAATDRRGACVAVIAAEFHSAAAQDRHGHPIRIAVLIVNHPGEVGLTAARSGQFQRRHSIG